MSLPLSGLEQGVSFTSGEAYGLPQPLSTEIAAALLAIIEALPQMACVADAQGRVVLANQQAQSFGALRLAQWRSHAHPDDLRPTERDSSDTIQFEKRIRSPESLIELRLTMPNGEWGWFGLSDQPLSWPEAAKLRLITALWVDDCKTDIDTVQGGYDLMVRMLDACDDCIKVLTPDGKLRHINRAGMAALGLSEGTQRGVDWPNLLGPDVRDLAREALAQAREGVSSRFYGCSERADGEKEFWDNLLTPISAADGQISEIICLSRNISAQKRHAEDLEATRANLEQLTAELSQALEAKAMLAGEMMHRVKNLFTVITGLISMSKREAPMDTPALAMMEGLTQRIFAMARATEMLMQGAPMANKAQSVDPLAVCAAVMSPYKDHFTLEGQVAPLEQNALTPLVLLIHELATNSIKHGAMRSKDGQITLRWSEGPGRLRLEWLETGGPKIGCIPSDEGFGSTMLRNVATMSGWAISHDWKADGLRVQVDMGRR